MSPDVLETPTASSILEAMALLLARIDWKRIRHFISILLFEYIEPCVTVTRNPSRYHDLRERVARMLVPHAFDGCFLDIRLPCILPWVRGVSEYYRDRFQEFLRVYATPHVLGRLDADRIRSRLLLLRRTMDEADAHAFFDVAYVFPQHFLHVDVHYVPSDATLRDMLTRDDAAGPVTVTQRTLRPGCRRQRSRTWRTLHPHPACDRVLRFR